jgi:hypothetical protein
MSSWSRKSQQPKGRRAECLGHITVSEGEQIDSTHRGVIARIHCNDGRIDLLTRCGAQRSTGVEAADSFARSRLRPQWHKTDSSNMRRPSWLARKHHRSRRFPLAPRYPGTIVALLVTAPSSGSTSAARQPPTQCTPSESMITIRVNRMSYSILAKHSLARRNRI